MFKSLGHAFSRSILQGGALFIYLPEWYFGAKCEASDTEVLTNISHFKYDQLLPLHACTSTVLSFLKQQESFTWSEETCALLDSTEGTEYMQIVSVSQWPKDSTFSMGNLKTSKKWL